MITIMLFSMNCFAQSTRDTAIPLQSNITMSNGATVSATFNSTTNVLSVDVKENEDEIEVIVTDNETIIETESTIFSEDNMEIPLSTSTNKDVDIYVRSNEETMYIGTVEVKE